MLTVPLGRPYTCIGTTLARLPRPQVLSYSVFPIGQVLDAVCEPPARGVRLASLEASVVLRRDSRLRRVVSLKMVDLDGTPVAMLRGFDEGKLCSQVLDVGCGLKARLVCDLDCPNDTSRHVTGVCLLLLSHSLGLSLPILLNLWSDGLENTDWVPVEIIVDPVNLLCQR